jgi:putative ABC transport system ATP-binding protein
VELPLVYQGVSQKERHRRSVEALEAVGLGDRVKHTPNELSGGQQQRVAIARALVSRPPILLADEPTGNLDSKSGMEIMKIMHDLHEQGNTVILITHDNNIAMQANRVVRIIDGQISEDKEVG